VEGGGGWVPGPVPGGARGGGDLTTGSDAALAEEVAIVRREHRHTSEQGRSGAWDGVGDGCWAIVGQPAWTWPENN
jgi:hypothetical protein